MFSKAFLPVLVSHTKAQLWVKKGPNQGSHLGIQGMQTCFGIFWELILVSTLSETNPRTLEVHVPKLQKFLYNLAHPPIRLEAPLHFITASTMQMVIMPFWLEGNDSEISSCIFSTCYTWK